MSTEFELVNSLIQRIYDAALEDSLWPSVIHDIANIIEADESLMFSPRLSTNDQFSVFSPYQHIDMAVWNDYESYYWQHDVWSNESISRGLLKNGTIVHGDQLLERSKFRQTEIFCDMYKPNMLGIEVVMAACIIDDLNKNYSSPVYLSFYRTAFSDAFTSYDEKFIGYLLPHIKHALSIRRKLLKGQKACELREQALEQMANAILLLDSSGRILFANKKAETLFSQVGNLKVKNGRFCSLDARYDSAIRQALKQAGGGIGSTLRIDSPTLTGYQIATFSSIAHTKADNLSAEARVMVIITEPDKPVKGDLSTFAVLYKLTPAETRVLKHLLWQQSTLEISETLRISMNTLRTQMKALFAKTNTKNQRELIGFCLSHPMID